MKWIKSFLGLCDHKWAVLERGKIKDKGVVVGSYYELQCEKCGDVKVRNLR